MARPEDLKSLVVAAHARGLMVLLDVVYNHFGPEGNYLPEYAPQFFDESQHTPWGAAINFGAASSRTVRDFFIHNALYWLEEFHFDGLRLDAVHAIVDASEPAFRDRARARGARADRARPPRASRARERPQRGALPRARRAGERALVADAQWNDDFHHALHVVATGERDGYYADYAERPLWYLGRTLAEGFAYQGEVSHLSRRRAARRARRSCRRPRSSIFAQTTTRSATARSASASARSRTLRCAAARRCVLPAGALRADAVHGRGICRVHAVSVLLRFRAELADAVRDGRRREFAAFEKFAGDAGR